MTDLLFLGAAGTVTGSKTLWSRGDLRILVDCGLFQGHEMLRLRTGTIEHCDNIAKCLRGLSCKICAFNDAGNRIPADLTGHGDNTSRCADAVRVASWLEPAVGLKYTSNAHCAASRSRKR